MEIFKDLLSTLKTFLDVIIKSQKVLKSESYQLKLDRKVATSSHCIISSVRPRSFVSPILLGLSSMMHKKYASKGITYSLSNLGLCCSYKETLRFEALIVQDPVNRRICH